MELPSTEMQKAVGEAGGTGEGGKERVDGEF